MKYFLRKFLESVLALSGIPFLIREVINRNRLTVVLYHEIDPNNFEKHARWYLRHYSVISMNDLGRHHSSFPKKPLLITFDDGYASNYELQEIVEILNLPIAIFLTTGLVGTSRKFWFDVPIDSSELHNLMKCDDRQKDEFLKEKYGYEKQKEYGQRICLSLDQVEKMHQSGLVSFQPHTEFHPVLTKLSDNDLRREIENSRNFISEQLGVTNLNAFASPFGKHSEREEDFLRRNGYTLLFTTDPGTNSLKLSGFSSIKRLGIPSDCNVSGCSTRASGLWSIITSLPLVRRASSFRSMDNAG